MPHLGTASVTVCQALIVNESLLREAIRVISPGVAVATIPGRPMRTQSVSG
jgi:hypothetical protein